MAYEYITRGTCSRKIFFDIQDGKVRNVRFVSGCDGNLQGVARLVEGMDVQKVIDQLKGIRAAGSPPPAPDQLARALEQAAGKA